MPSFNKNISILGKIDKRLKIIGSAHNYREITIKKKQRVDLIFISPIFKVKKKTEFLDVCKFNILSKMTKKKIIALGGINKENIRITAVTPVISLKRNNENKSNPRKIS